MKNEPEIQSDTRQRILDAAHQLFLRTGYARTTTRQIAIEAGVNEVTLFRHFGSKQKLFEAIVEQGARLDQLFAALQAPLTGDFESDLQHIGRFFMRLMLEKGDMVRLMLCEAAHFPDMAAGMVQNPQRLRQWLAKYLREQMQNGKVRELDAEIMAQAFFGMFFSYGVLQNVLNDPLMAEVNADEVSRQFVECFSAGVMQTGAKGEGDQ